jgi:hypothetical protein
MLKRLKIVFPIFLILFFSVNLITLAANDSKLVNNYVGSLGEKDILAPKEIKSIITPKDKGVSIFQQWENISPGKHTFTMESIRPDGPTDKFSITHSVKEENLKSKYFGWGWALTFEEDNLSKYPGEWNVLFYLDGDLKGKTTFNIKLNEQNLSDTKISEKKKIKEFVSSEKKYGKFATSKSEGKWELGEKIAVYTTEGKFLFLLEGNNVAAVYNYNDDGSINEQLYKKQGIKIPKNLFSQNNDQKLKPKSDKDIKKTIDKEKKVKAFDIINFGDSKSDVSEKVRKSKVINKPFLQGPRIEINGFVYRMFFEYYNDKLYEINFRSFSNDASYFDTKLKNKRDTLTSAIRKQYGANDFYSDVGFLDLRNGYITWSHIWDIGENKKIKIGMSESDYKYFAEMRIEYLPLINEKESKENKASEESIEEAADKF